MSDFPDFTQISLAGAASLRGAASAYRGQYNTAEAIDIQSMAMPYDAPMVSLTASLETWLHDLVHHLLSFQHLRGHLE